MRYAYARGGAPLLDWTNGPPAASRAADTLALGSLGGTTLSGPTIVLPRPGAPEVIDGAGVGMAGCSCTGSCGCGSGTGVTAALSDFVDSVPGGYLTLAAAALVAWKLLGKKRRR